jgi:hypothetical protein
MQITRVGTTPSMVGPADWFTGNVRVVQRAGAPIEQVRPGDVVFFEGGEKHWHGASSQVGMTHIAITEVLDGKAVDWLEPVTDEEYAQ